jgi:hypothetical protein
LSWEFHSFVYFPLNTPGTKEQDSGPNHFNSIYILEKCAKKHVSLAAKLFMLLLLGLSGMYIFFLNVDQRISNKRSRKVFSSESRATSVTCHHKNDHSIPVHYPQPSSYDRTECVCTPVHNFVIVSMQRCGSGWFEALLNSHPNISSHGEVFLDETKRENFGSIKKILDTIYNLDWKSSASKNDCTSAVGFKWMLNQQVLGIQKFLGVIPRKLTSHHVKIHTQPLSKQIQNWLEVYEMLKGTEFEGFLGDK